MSHRDELLDDELVARKLRRLAGWTLHDTIIMRGYNFDSFSRAIAYVMKVAGLAESAGHYPDMDIRGNRVIISLTTPELGGLTQADFLLARECEKAAQE